jgi:hypothetical protein
MALSSLPFKLFNDLRAEYDTDVVLVAHRQEILEGAQDDKWAVVDGLSTMGGRIFIPASSPCLAAHNDFGARPWHWP